VLVQPVVSPKAVMMTTNTVQIFFTVFLPFFQSGSN